MTLLHFFFGGGGYKSLYTPLSTPLGVGLVWEFRIFICNRDDLPNLSMHAHTARRMDGAIYLE